MGIFLNAFHRAWRGLRDRKIPAQKARDRFWSSIRPTDVFLVSCPKSGTTWLTFLLIHLLNGDFDSKLNLRTSASFVPDVNRLLQTDKRIPASFFWHIEDLKNPRIFRVHARYEGRMPNVIYLLRDPRDVMVSQWHYLKGTKKSFQMSLREFVEINGIEISWEESVKEWLVNNHMTRMICIRYEDLQSDPYRVLAELIEFLGVRPPVDSVSRAIEASSFSNMKRLEEEFGSAESFLHGERFVRQGKSRSWVDEMDGESIKIANMRFRNLLERFGYDA